MKYRMETIQENYEDNIAIGNNQIVEFNAGDPYYRNGKKVYVKHKTYIKSYPNIIANAKLVNKRVEKMLAAKFNSFISFFGAFTNIENTEILLVMEFASWTMEEMIRLNVKYDCGEISKQLLKAIINANAAGLYFDDLSLKHVLISLDETGGHSLKLDMGRAKFNMKY